MNTAFRYESSVAQFQENPFTREWPESTAIDALFRYCVERLLTYCRNAPLNWLTEGDLQALLCQILRDELPRHGLPACAVHLGYIHSTPIRQEQPCKHQRIIQMIDLVLVIPQTIRWTNETRWEAELSVIASIKRGHEHIAEIRDELIKLTAIKGGISGLMRYLVVMGYQDTANQIEQVKQSAQASGIAYIGDNYSSMTEPVTQEKLL
jgi:hypothetical protein